MSQRKSRRAFMKQTRNASCAILKCRMAFETWARVHIHSGALLALACVALGCVRHSRVGVATTLRNESFELEVGGTAALGAARSGNLRDIDPRQQDVVAVSYAWVFRPSTSTDYLAANGP